MGSPSTSGWLNRIAAVAIAIPAALSAMATSARGADALPQLGADISQTSVSGLSSGAYMAGQFQIAHSSVVTGAAIIAGGPYGCAESVASRLAPFWMTAVGANLTQALKGCMANDLASWGIPNVRTLAERASGMARDARIDPLPDLKTDRIYLYSGEDDTVILGSIVAAAYDFYRELGVPAGNIRFIRNGRGGHALITESEGAACGLTAEPFLNDCDYDQAGDFLKHIYGSMQPPAATLSGTFREFGQKPFQSGNTPSGMAETGVVYVPEACVSGRNCRIHVAFHGCAQGREFVADAHIKGSGLARWADTNRLIVLFPQIRSEAVNPKGCWDWWGYTQLDYRSKKAPQIAAVRRMIEALAK